MEHLRGITNILAAVVLWGFILFITIGVGIVGLIGWGYFVFANAEKRHGDALLKLQNTLMPDEVMRVTAVQLRPFALWNRRKSLGITDSRIIILSRGLLGGFAMRDIQWKDLQDAELNENVLPDICGSSLSFLYKKRDLGSVARRRHEPALGGAPSLFVGGVPSDEARIIYAHAQAEEQAWEEKRRVRAIEETRAAAGGVYLNTGHGPERAPGTKDTTSLVGELTNLKQLLDTGVISDAEFQEMKAKIIARA